MNEYARFFHTFMNEISKCLYTFMNILTAQRNKSSSVTSDWTSFQ